MVIIWFLVIWMVLGGCGLHWVVFSGSVSLCTVCMYNMYVEFATN